MSEPNSEKVFFKNPFNLSEDDKDLLHFLNMKANSVFERFLRAGYSKQAIADGFIHAITQWRNK